MIKKEIRSKGTPKFKCNFYIDYEPYDMVTSFRTGLCTHRQNFDNCPITVTDKRTGCEISAKIKNKNKNVLIKEPTIRLKCPRTPAPPQNLLPSPDVQVTQTIQGD